jgi:LacI family transcriptional regulator
MATMKDVAKAAGVSIATVSATLSGTSFVSPELRARITAAIGDLGYERNSAASGLKRGKSLLIGLVVSDVTNPFFTELVHGVQNLAREKGYSVVLGISDHDVEREAELLRLMRSHQAAGTILCPAGSIENYAATHLNLGRMNVVAVDNAAPQLPFDTITLDNTKAAILAVRHILSFGHRRVATIAGPERQYVSQKRLEGFRIALEEKGIAFDSTLVLHGDFRTQSAFQSCMELIAKPNRPTAIFVANNLMLIGVMQALTQAGLSVPGDMSIASIDDFPWSSAFQPSLTVVRQPISMMAAAALDSILKRIDGDSSASTRQVFEPELIVRQSCAPPSRALPATV